MFGNFWIISRVYDKVVLEVSGLFCFFIDGVDKGFFYLLLYEIICY